MKESITTPTGGGSNLEKKEKKEFTLEEICQLLKVIDDIDGKERKERPNLFIEEEIKNIKGELMAVVFSDNEQEDGSPISYLLTLPGQRYKPDGTEGRFIEYPFLTKDYDGGVFSKQLADYIKGEWVIKKK